MATPCTAAITGGAMSTHTRTACTASTRIAPEVLDIPGITAARRFKASDVAPPGDDAHQYCAVYELDVDDLSSVMPALAERFADGSMHMSDAMEMDPTPSFVIYEQLD